MTTGVDTRPRRFLFGGTLAIGSWIAIEVGRRIAGAVAWAVVIAFGPLLVGGLSLCALVVVAAIRDR